MSVVRKELADLRVADCWIFDLDNTLYPIVNNLFPQVEVRMTQFICEPSVSAVPNSIEIM